MVGGWNAKLLLVCLVWFESAQTRSLKETTLSKSSPPPVAILDSTVHEISEGLYEGDIVLTQEQMVLLQERKATDISKYWPRDSSGIVTVGYRFGDDIIDREKVLLAVAHWEENTCIRFEEVSSDVGYVHFNFTDATGCASFVGRINSKKTGQTIWLHKSCVNNFGSTVHEIGHALGFFHEQSRSDRDDHVKIMYENIMAGREGNFHKSRTLNFGVPYDYGSVMHYGAKFFSSNGQDTILAINPLAQPVMGSRKSGLTFADQLVANNMYGCLDQWLTECSITSDPCQNLGYTGPDCNCVCPEGTSGAQCQVLQESYTDALIKLRTPHSEKISTEGVVSTPGYPTPIQTAMMFVKVLVAPSCHRVRLTVTDLQVSRRSWADKCAFDALTIRTQDELGSGTAYCGQEIAPGTVFISENNTIVLDYHNRDYTRLSWDSTNRGFNATIEHILADGCTPVTTTQTSTTSLPVISIINNGVVPLTMGSSSSGFCRLAASSVPGQYELTSRQGPDLAWPEDSCSAHLETIEPRYLSVTAAEVETNSRDSILIDGLFGSKVSITGSEAGDSFVFPSSFVHIFANALTAWFGNHFKLKIEVLNSDCHQIVEAEAGGTGTLNKPNYAAATVCEWWIQAPSGSEIQLDFTSFDVGQSDCSADYLAIDTSGDRRYGAASQQYCGSNTPGSVTSTGGQLNVLLNGLQGGQSGFSATFSVV